MKGHIRQRAPGTWSIAVYLGRGLDGKRKYRWQTVRGTKRDAERELTKILHGINAGTYVEPTKVTLGEYLRGWLEDYARVHVAPTTYQGYSQIVNQHVIPALGHHLLSRLSPTAVKAYYAATLRSGRRDGSGGLSPTTVLQHHRVLREALKHAVHDGLLALNPCDRVPAPRRVRKKMIALDEEQSARLLEFAQGTRLFIPVMLAVATGMRRGEILALRWEDVDLRSARITVNRTLETTKAGLRFKEPKTASSRRSIVMPALLVEALSKHKVEQAKERLKLGPAYEDNDLVCAGPDGRPWRPNSLSPAFRTLIKRAGLPQARFHDLRHTHASQLLRQGIHPKIVSEHLGHSSIGLTLDTYTHLLPNMQEEAAQKIDLSLSQAMKSATGEGISKGFAKPVFRGSRRFPLVC